jgi:hypothetical protein
MASLLTPEEFIGLHKLAGSIENDILLQQYIDEYEKDAVYKLFGITMGKAMIADAGYSGGTWANANLEKVFKPFQEVGSGDEQWVSKGLKEILKAYILWHYASKTTVQHTQAGVTTDNVDTQSKVDPGRFAETRWNQMLDSWEAIQAYIDENSADYPDYVYIPAPQPKFNGLL